VFVSGAHAGRRSLACALFALAVLALAPARGEPVPAAPSGGFRLHRTWMPDAYPSSFAVGFPDGLNFCFDPVRGNVIYAWRGNFVDLAPTVAGKIPRNAVVIGTIFYRDPVHSRFKVGGADAVADVQFRGYEVKQGVPEFRYEVGGIEIRESIAPTPEGKALIRRFRLSTAEKDVVYQTPDGAHVAVEAGPARTFVGGLHLPAKASIIFTLTAAAP
jgi:hypothetical protein